MKIPNINLNAINTSKYQNTSTTTPYFKANFDIISFTSKTPEQILLTKEAKDLSKESYAVFAKGKNIQKQGQWKNFESSKRKMAFSSTEFQKD